MRVIITGGSGTIGRALTSALTARGDEVIILSRSPERVKNLPAGARAVKWDSRTAEGWGHLADGAGAVVNLAGAGIADKRWTPERKELILNSRLDATRATVAAIEAAENRPAVLIQGSAVGFYGDRGDETLTEHAAPGDGFVADVVKAWEEAAEPAAALTRLVTIRTGVVLTTESGALPRIVFPPKIWTGGSLGGEKKLVPALFIVGSGRQWISWIHIEDEVAAILWLIDNDGASGPYNLTAPDVTTNKQLTKAIGKVLNRPALPLAPPFLLKLILGELAATVLEGQRVVPHRLVAEGFTFRHPHPVPALRDILYNDK